MFNILKKIEKILGRITNKRWGPREIDLDLLFYNDKIFSNENLTVPHIGIPERDFVLVPLCEIEPGLIHPALNKKVCEIEIKKSENNIIRKLPDKLI